MAEPGTVVFLPPGVLHETHTRTGSYAIGFAIERTESLAGIIAEEIRGTLQGIPMLRAARFGAQFQDIEQDKRVAADALRCLADAIESPDWRNTEARFRLRPGLIAEALGPTCIVLRGAGAARTFSLDEMPVAMLGWASGRSAFSSRDLAHDLPLIDPELADTYVQQLIHLGLVERVA
jgi:hypothetical protein